jgi:integrase
MQKYAEIKAHPVTIPSQFSVWLLRGLVPSKVERPTIMAKPPAPVEGVYERVVGSGKWYARYYIDNKQVRKSFGRDREAAVTWVETARTVKRSGKGLLPLSAKIAIKTADDLAADQAAAALAASRSGTLLSELCDGLLKELMENSEADHRTPPSRIARIKRELGHRVAISILPQEIKKWLNGLRSESIYPKREEGVDAPKVNPATANRLRTQLSAIYQYAITEGLLPRNFRNPVRDVKVKKLGAPLKRWMDDAEETRLREVLQRWVDASGGPKHERQRKRLTHHLKELDVVFNSGMRKANMFGIRWPQVDFDRHQITLGKTKNGSPLLVPMNEDAEAALHWLQANPMKRKSRSAAQPNQAPADSVFALANPKGWLKKALKEAGITSKFRWHDTRHTVGTRMAQEGVELKTIMEVMGQTTPQAALGYQHMADKQRRAAVVGLSRAGRAAAQLNSQPA